MPFREQWANCYVRTYRNFGLRTNSPTEAAHKDLKTYLFTGKCDLRTLVISIRQMLDHRHTEYVQKAAKMEHRQLYKYTTTGWLGELAYQISSHAVRLLCQQHKLATSAIKTQIQLSRCEAPCAFSQRYALPCAHIIQKILAANKPLEFQGIHPRWWLKKPLVSLWSTSLV
jgi:hypothetical protein